MQLGAVGPSVSCAQNIFRGEDGQAGIPYWSRDLRYYCPTHKITDKLFGLVSNFGRCCGRGLPGLGPAFQTTRLRGEIETLDPASLRTPVLNPALSGLAPETQQEDTSMQSHRLHPPRLAGGWSPVDVLIVFLFVLLFSLVIIAFGVIGQAS